MSNTDIDPLGKFVTNTQYVARIEGGLQSSQPTGSERKIEIESDNGGNITKLIMNSDGITINLPSNDDSHFFKIENSSLQNLFKVSTDISILGSIAIGNGAGQTNQGTGALAVGAGAGAIIQSLNTTAIGLNAGQQNQSTQSLSIGNNSGQQGQGTTSTAIGPSTAQTNQGQYAVAIGYQAGKSGQSDSTVAIGLAATLNQGLNSTAIGHVSGFLNQGANSITIGVASGAGQGIQSVCLGRNAGRNFNQDDTVLIGYNAAVGVGAPAAVIDNGIGTTCIGAESKHKGTYGVALGYEAAGKVTYPVNDNSFYIGTKGLGTATDHSINSENTTGSDFRLLCLNTKDGEVSFIAPVVPATIPLLTPGVNVKQLTFNTATGELGYNGP